MANRPDLRPVEGLEVLVLVDNVTDQLSTNPEGVQSEFVALMKAGLRTVAGAAICSAHHGLSLLGDGARRRRHAHGAVRHRAGGLRHPAQWRAARRRTRVRRKHRALARSSSPTAAGACAWSSCPTTGSTRTRPRGTCRPGRRRAAGSRAPSEGAGSQIWPRPPSRHRDRQTTSRCSRWARTPRRAPAGCGHQHRWHGRPRRAAPGELRLRTDHHPPWSRAPDSHAVRGEPSVPVGTAAARTDPRSHALLAPSPRASLASPSPSRTGIGGGTLRAAYPRKEERSGRPCSHLPPSRHDF